MNRALKPDRQASVNPDANLSFTALDTTGGPGGQDGRPHPKYRIKPEPASYRCTIAPAAGAHSPQ